MEKYNFDDFLTKSNNETASKMDLLLDGEKTGHYLMVKGIEAKEVQRARVDASIAYADIEESIEKIDDKADKVTVKKGLKLTAEINLALELVTGWSFGEFNKEKLQLLLTENDDLSLQVIGWASTAKNYLQKK